jgi:hypothetical protein
MNSFPALSRCVPDQPEAPAHWRRQSNNPERLPSHCSASAPPQPEQHDTTHHPHSPFSGDYEFGACAGRRPSGSVTADAGFVLLDRRRIPVRVGLHDVPGGLSSTLECPKSISCWRFVRKCLAINGASVAQLVEQLTLNQLVEGSSPSRGTNVRKSSASLEPEGALSFPP